MFLRKRGQTHQGNSEIISKILDKKQRDRTTICLSSEMYYKRMWKSDHIYRRYIVTQDTLVRRKWREEVNVQLEKLSLSLIAI